MVPEALRHNFFLRRPLEVNLTQVVIADEQFSCFPVVQPSSSMEDSSYDPIPRFCKLMSKQMSSLCGLMYQCAFWLPENTWFLLIPPFSQEQMACASSNTGLDECDAAKDKAQKPDCPGGGSQANAISSTQNDMGDS